MKTTLKVTLVLALALLAGNLFASGNLKLNIHPLNDEKAFVSISALTNADLKISITDDCGNLVYYQESEAPATNYRKVFNFSELENGIYSMKVVSNDLVTERQIKKTTNNIAIGDERTVGKPFFCVDDNILKYSYMNYAQENIVFHLYGNDQEIYKRNVGRDFIVQQALGLSKLRQGQYQAVLTAGNEQFTYNIEVK